VGLKAFGGKLNTFYGPTPVTHADTRFIPHDIGYGGAAPTKIHYCDQFNAQMYVVAEYAPGTFRHHYLDGTVPPVITDANCPHTKQVAKQTEKIFAASGPNVRYCATGTPRDWTLASDAGFFPAGLYAVGSDQVTALGAYSKKGLAVFFSDNAMLLGVDPDPELIDLTDSIESVGTLYHRSAVPVANDLMFLAQNGFRSISLVVLTGNLQDNDVGSPVDDLVRPSYGVTDDPLSIYFPMLGQTWSINREHVWVYSFSRTAKLSAWSEYTFPFALDDATVLNQELFVRAGDDVYKATDEVNMDGTVSIPLVEATMQFQDGKKPGVMKQFIGADFIGTGSAEVSYLFAADNQDLESLPYTYPPVTEPGVLYPVEIVSTRIAPKIRHQADEPFQLDAMLLHYESLAVR